MDLLGAYDSNSDSEDDEVPQNRNDAKPADGENLPATKNIASTSAKSRSAALKASASTKSSAKDKKRGKKILKLAAVLPEHIWNQLTAGNAAGEDDGDDSEDDNKRGKDTRVETQNTAKPAKSIQQKASQDSGLQSLLNELPKSKSTVLSQPPNILGQNIENDAEDNTTEETPANNTPHESSSLGFAFLTSTVETTRRKRNAQDNVENIHAKKEPPSSAPTKKAPPVATASSSLAYASLPSRPQAVPRPTASRVAPLRPAAPMPTNSHHLGAAAAPFATHQQHPNASYATSQQTFSSRPAHAISGKKKQSRKRQMEQMLRAGNIHEFEGDHEIEGTAHTYTPDVETGPTYQAHGVRVVPTTSYNVGAGTTVATTDISGRQRTKHQLNSLLASAASLESHRLNNPHLTGTGRGTTHRASAKRKYGW
jgi:hypothetical protein